MLEVIGAGLPRTGTTSMKAALDRLGFGPCFHTFEVLRRPDLADRWLPACSGEPLDWERTFAGYRSTQDWPAAFFWRELAAAYPRAKVVLTVRDPHAWYTSFRVLGSADPRGPLRPEDAAEAVRPVVAALERMRPLFEHIARTVFGEDVRLGEKMPEEDRAVAAYHRHLAAVRAAIPAERLLVFDVRQGWEPLCAFLGAAPPPAEPFPHLNDAASFRRMFQLMRTEGRLHTPFPPDP
ncbi:sulfotransferase family protein [Sphaerisporangium melleum]|uniref:Sulfotransferase family protein n=1 Tax=Sphaerisporangium melleum TaxID=321316 RepID=A0A917VKG2_9ACTN|nr:sulfotransferase family protein [Sphaerisporangium melleum]GGK94056.1 sulfotransferase family protein [Sphaerisporangium melleum]GII73347.1 sulfotransferase family protein [Sphaerisporangium melleum]